MPTVRFGPDIADDAAYLMNQILDALDMEDAIRNPDRAARFSKRERERIRRNAESARRWAKEVFGVTDDMVSKRQFGLMGTLAAHSLKGRRVSTRKWDEKTGRFRYVNSSRKRLKVVGGRLQRVGGRNKRVGGELVKRSVADEFARREGKDKAKASGRRAIPTDTARLGKRGEAGGTYTGFTMSKGYRNAQAAVLRNLRRKGGKVTVGGKTMKVRTITDLDNLGLAKRPLVGSQKIVRDKAGRATGVTRGKAASIRPRKAKSAKQAARRQRQRAGTVATAGRRATNQSTARGRGRR